MTKYTSVCPSDADYIKVKSCIIAARFCFTHRYTNKTVFAQIQWDSLCREVACRGRVGPKQNHILMYCPARHLFLGGAE